MPEKAEHPKTDFAFIDDVNWVNQKPHPFCIGPRHVEYASEHCNGILGEEACKKFPCAMKVGGHGYHSGRSCGLPYDQHTKGDHVAFVKLTRNCSNAEMHDWLKTLVGSEWATTNKVDGFAFVDTGYRIAPPVTGE